MTAFQAGPALRTDPLRAEPPLIPRLGGQHAPVTAMGTADGQGSLLRDLTRLNARYSDLVPSEAI